MKIGISYDVKTDFTLQSNEPEDMLEEYDSQETVESISESIAFLGHIPVQLGGGRSFLENILKSDVDFVFNISEGRGNFRGREVQIPSVLEMLGIPYSGSDPTCLAICLDKAITKQIVSSSGILTPKWVLIKSRNDIRKDTFDDMSLPCFVKPAWEGSSKGINLSSKVETRKQMIQEVEKVLDIYKQPVLVEEFIAGDELTVGLCGYPVSVLGIMHIKPLNGNDPSFVYSIEVKRDWKNLVAYECPPLFTNELTENISNQSIEIFNILGCRDTARIDFRLSEKGLLYFLEANPLPGLCPGHSDLPIIAEKMGYKYHELIGFILESALRREHLWLKKSA